MLCVIYQGAQLQREMKKEEEKVQTMKDELEKAQKDYENMFSAMQYKLTNMEVCKSSIQ